MPGNCDTIYEWISQAEERQAKALDALNSATENAALAVASLAAANTWAASCNLLIVDPPAYAICEVPALAAVTAAAEAVKIYQDKANEAAQSYKAVQNSLQILQNLLNSCQVADADNKSDEVDHALSDAKEQLDTVLAIEIVDVPSQAIADADSALAAAESATEDAQAKQQEDGALA